MTATLTFTLPEEQHEFDVAVHGGDWRLVVEGLDQELRNELKYGSTYDAATVEWVRTRLHAEMTDRNVVLFS